MNRSSRLLFLTAACLCAVPAWSAAPAANPSTAVVAGEASGVIAGRVHNAKTGEYVRNAEVRIDGTSLIATSEDDGSYRLTGVAAGPAVLVVTYTGYPTARATLMMTAGAQLMHDVELGASPAAAAEKSGETIVLDQFVVSTEREGNAKAIMSQRNSMNITNSVASDVFGDMTEGNIGDFLKNMPGVDLETVEGEIRTVRLRGLGSEYTAVTLDGVSLASADANQGASGNARAFSFEQVSLSSMDSIEISKTVSADVDANAPAGTINLKTKRAFDRQGRRITWQANVSANSEAMNLGRTYGPDNAKHRKLRPGGMFEYSDVFFNRKLGVVLNVSESQIFSNSARSTMAYNYTTTATDPRPVVPSTISQVVGPRITERFTTTLTADYRATPNLSFGLVLLYNYYDINFHLRTALFTLGTRSAVVGADPLAEFTASASNTSMSVTGQGISKSGNTFSYVPKFEYKRGDFRLEGVFADSDSKNWYNPMGRRDMVFSSGAYAIAGAGFTGKRSAYKTGGWDLTQIKGGDWSNGASYRPATVTVNDGRSARNRTRSGELIASLRTRKVVPVTWKTGYKHRREIRDFQQARNLSLYTFTGDWKDLRLPYSLDLDQLDGGSAVSSSGGALFVPDIQKLAVVFREHPEYFNQTTTLTAANYYAATYANLKHYVEDIDAAYFMGTSRVGKMQFRAGLRWEGTATDTFDPDPRTAAELKAAGFPETNGRATTIPGIEYQYGSKPFVHNTGYYGKFFPSGSFKYRFRPNLELHLGYSHTMRRPTFNDIAGVWTINDDTNTVSAPNVKLTPETSDNLSARMAYYFEPVGIVAVSVYQNTVKGLFVDETGLTAEEFGYTGPLDLGNYLFNTTVQSNDRVKLRGIELEYSQSLSFLPGPFSGLSVNASYTRNEASNSGVSGWRNPLMAPNAVTAGLSYAWRGVTVYARSNWYDDTPTNSANTNFRRHRFSVDTGGAIKLRRNVSLFWTVRNVLNEPYITMQRRENCPPVAINWGSFGAACTFGIKGTF